VRIAPDDPDRVDQLQAFEKYELIEMGSADLTLDYRASTGFDVSAIVFARWALVRRLPAKVWVKDVG
jgi:hypothetical protein